MIIIYKVFAREQKKEGAFAVPSHINFSINSIGEIINYFNCSQKEQITTFSTEQEAIKAAESFKIPRRKYVYFHVYIEKLIFNNEILISSEVIKTYIYGHKIFEKK